MHTQHSARARRAGRRSLAAAVTAGVAVLGLAACSGGTASTPSDSTGGSASGSAGGGSTTLTVWHYFSDANQVKLMDEYAKKFEDAHPDVTVDNVFVPYDQMNSKLVSAAGAKTGPDIAVFNGAETATIALGGALAPLDDYWSSYSDAAQFPDSVIHKVDGKTYAVQGYVNLLGLWYNADILKEIGVQPPTTIDELEKDMAAAKAAGYQGITLCGLPQSQGEWQAYPWLTSQGFTYDSPDQSSLAAGLSMVRGWVTDGYLSQEAVTWDQTVPFQKFAAGGIAFAENGNWQMGTAASDAKFNYGVVPLPLGSDGKVYLGGEGEGIGAFSKHPDLAWQYLTETYLDRQGQLLPVKIVGSIPSRLDAAKDDTVTSNELLKPFAETIAKYGANYPASVISPDAVADVQLTVGQAWSAALGGQQSPDTAASTAVQKLSSLLG
ncbi:sugar ABC transporter substrate-binding protein [Isoptericola sp. b441]|uniref:Sugar ABC transporter substrate-binding protein n=1 Tax=Actinotalea lenta TaxID=3064654 RepID=A0ABT9D778_9CELL|nr:sugar ABC transporter substrate-binding protein [Isoptericola sp. b441]MDO8106696.1 sugar ABC transporter substrate-binding protein [Isoptericola sp. b441]